MSHEETYPVDLYARGDSRDQIVRMADSVASRLRRAGLVGRTVTLKVRSADFVTRTRSHSGPEHLSDGPSIAVRALALLAAEDVSRGVRLIGVGVSNLTAMPARAGPADAVGSRRGPRSGARNGRSRRGARPGEPSTRCGVVSARARWAPPPCSAQAAQAAPAAPARHRRTPPLGFAGGYRIHLRARAGE